MALSVGEQAIEPSGQIGEGKLELQKLLMAFAEFLTAHFCQPVVILSQPATTTLSRPNKIPVGNLSLLTSQVTDCAWAHLATYLTHHPAHLGLAQPAQDGVAVNVAHLPVRLALVQFK